ncbi:hypothetical protein TNCV_4098901 [Trichonephila clavipes]|nr:hypothetical protein TNCV_4098901 [Trichonephila clavipes]
MVISKLLQQFQTTGTITRRTGKDRRRVTTSVEVHYRDSNAYHHEGITSRTLSRDVAAKSGTAVSKQAVYRQLAETSLYARKSVMCALLPSFTREPVYLEAVNTNSWIEKDWCHVRFTNESSSVTENIRLPPLQIQILSSKSDLTNDCKTII